MSNNEIRQQGKGWVAANLEILSTKWAHVATNLVSDLPKSNEFAAIVVFVDRLTKMLHLPGCKKELTTMEYA